MLIHIANLYMFVYLCLSPHPIVIMTHLWIHGVYEHVYVRACAYAHMYIISSLLFSCRCAVDVYGF